MLVKHKPAGLDSVSESLCLMPQAKEKDNLLHMLSEIQHEVESEYVHHQCHNPSNAAK